VSRPTKEKLTVPLAVLRQINYQACRKKAVAFDRDQIVGASIRPVTQQRSQAQLG
jgi:hypothetical protein